MSREYQMYVDGQWVGAASGQTFDDCDPYTGTVVATIPSASRQDARRAVEVAAAAGPAWGQMPPNGKRMLFLKAAEILEQRRQEIGQILAEETGATFGVGMSQVELAAGLLREAASQVHSLTGEIIPADLPGAFFMAIRQPVGVVAGIAPWNVPLYLSLRSIVLPLTYGNTAVLKPSAESPISGGLVLAEIFDEAGFPKGVLNVVTNAPGQSEEVGDEFVENPLVRRISFTGSTDVGRRLAEKSARHLKRTVLELGGHNPILVLRDADVDYAVQAAAFGAFAHQGQTCMSARRIIVERPVAEEFTEKLVHKARNLKVGNPKEPDTVIGPIINRRQLETIQTRVEEAVAGGAKILCGGRSEGPCYCPTVLADVTDAMSISHEEIFGPVVSLHVVEDASEAVRVANSTCYGLSAAIITRDFEQGLALAERIESGMVHINDSPILDEPQAPFGGIKDSGWGHIGGRAAVEEFTELRWITMQRTPRPYPF